MILKTESESRGSSHLSHSSKMLKQAEWEGGHAFPSPALASPPPHPPRALGLLLAVLPPRSSFCVKVLTFVLS